MKPLYESLLGKAGGGVSMFNKNALNTLLDQLTYNELVDCLASHGWFPDDVKGDVKAKIANTSSKIIEKIHSYLRDKYFVNVNGLEFDHADEDYGVIKAMNFGGGKNFLAVRLYGHYYKPYRGSNKYHEAIAHSSIISIFEIGENGVRVLETPLTEKYIKQLDKDFTKCEKYSVVPTCHQGSKSEKKYELNYRKYLWEDCNVVLHFNQQ